MPRYISQQIFVQSEKKLKYFDSLGSLFLFKLFRFLLNCFPEFSEIFLEFLQQYAISLINLPLTQSLCAFIYILLVGILK